MELVGTSVEGSKQQLEVCCDATMTTSGCRLENVWKMGMVIAISVLLVNPAIATEKSEITTHPLSVGVLENFTDISVPTSPLLSLGTQPIKKPHHVRHEENHQNSKVARERQSLTGLFQFSQPRADVACAFSQVVVTQDNIGNLPNGLPIFHVTIMNNCIACSMEDIHVACGDFASDTEVDPAIFRRLDYNNCIVNNGSPMAPLNLLFFEYSSSFSYPMGVNDGRACSC